MPSTVPSSSTPIPVLSPSSSSGSLSVGAHPPSSPLRSSKENEKGVGGGVDGGGEKREGFQITRWNPKCDGEDEEKEGVEEVGGEVGGGRGGGRVFDFWDFGEKESGDWKEVIYLAHQFFFSPCSLFFVVFRLDNDQVYIC